MSHSVSSLFTEQKEKNGSTKFKAFTDDRSNFAKMTISVYDRIENNVGKGENADYQHFLLFLQCFQKALPSRS